jgi:hypothetical protein
MHTEHTGFPRRLKTVYSYDHNSDPPTIMVSQCKEGEEKMSGEIILTEDVFVDILEHVSQMRPEIARACARVYWRAVKRGKRKAGDALDECGIVEHLMPLPGNVCVE